MADSIETSWNNPKTQKELKLFVDKKWNDSNRAQPHTGQTAFFQRTAFGEEIILIGETIEDMNKKMTLRQKLCFFNWLKKFQKRKI